MSFVLERLREISLSLETETEACEEWGESCDSRKVRS